MRQHLNGKYTILIAGILASLLSASCGSGQNQIDSQATALTGQPEITVPSQSNPFEIGGISELDRNASYTDEDRILLGAEFGAGLPNQGVVTNGDAAVFSPNFAPSVDSSLITPAFAIYAFELSDYDQEIQLEFGLSDDPASEDDIHLAFANYDSMRWSWSMTDGSRTISVTDYENYISPEGRIYFTILFTGLDPATLDFVRIGTGFAPTGSLKIDTAIGDYPLVVNLEAEFTDIDGEIVEYRWDWNNDGTIDETTAVGTIQHVYEIPGTYVTRVHAVDNNDMTGTDFKAVNVTGTLPPDPPLNLVASDGTWGGQIHLDWEPAEGGTIATSYSIERGESSGGPFTEIATVIGAFTEYSDTSITDQETYWYRIFAKNATVGNSDPSNVDDGFMGILLPPVNLACGQGTLPDRISIGWNHPPTGPTPDGYDLFRSPSEDGIKTKIATLDFVDFHQDTTIIDGSTYYYFLQSRKVNFPNSDYTPFATGFVSQLQAPTEVMASDDASPTTITISWTHSTGSQVPGGYRIFRAPAEDGPYFNIGNAGYVETWDDNTVTDGAVYYYRVAAYKSGWPDSPNSESFDTGYVGLSAPQGLTASDDSFATDITVTWLPPSNGPVPDEYEVFRSTSIDGTYASIGAVSGFNFIDSGISLGQIYYYKAIAKKSGYTDSAYSNTDDGYAGVI